MKKHYLFHLGSDDYIKAAGLLKYKCEKSLNVQIIINNEKHEKNIFHLLTDKKTFKIKEIIFNDYNYYLDNSF